MKHSSLLSLPPSLLAGVSAAPQPSLTSATNASSPLEPLAGARRHKAGGRPMRNYPAADQPAGAAQRPDWPARCATSWRRGPGSLGVHCDFCHTADPKNLGPNGRPRMNFADDSKPDKKIARIMYTMTQQINKDTSARRWTWTRTRWDRR